jgi:folylpolyglutamate synthase
LERELARLSVVHVAGTKGKGSTCAMVESILRAAGWRTGLYTSPHLVDVRERVRLGGAPVSRGPFLRHLRAALARLAERAGDDAGKPAYFRFLTLLAFRIFLEENVDVAVLEVGLGGRLDATNCVRAPVVCGVSALGMDHVEILGDTLEKIAAEKAGIFKAGAPAVTVAQPPGAAAVLRAAAERVGAQLAQARPLDEYVVEGENGAKAPAAALEVGLAGAHQRQNAALAIALAAAWEARSGAAAGGARGAAAAARAAAVARGALPAEYAAGLRAVRWPGRAQIVHDVGAGAAGATADGSPSAAAAASRLTFFLDGAHTDESVALCGRWFADAAAAAAAGAPPAPGLDTRRLLLFNCTEERDPRALLAPLARELAARGAAPHAALFAPPDSAYARLGPGGAPPDLAWQASLRGVWERLQAGEGGAGGAAPPAGAARLPPLPPLPPAAAAATAGAGRALEGGRGAAVMPGLAATLEWLRRAVREAPALRLQVLVTGSLYVVGDLLKLLGNPKP